MAEARTPPIDTPLLAAEKVVKVADMAISMAAIAALRPCKEDTESAAAADMNIAAVELDVPATLHTAGEEDTPVTASAPKGLGLLPMEVENTPPKLSIHSARGAFNMWKTTTTPMHRYA